MTAHLPAGHGQLPLLPADHEYLVRQLHLLFEPTDKSFSHTLLAMRLVEARRQIESVPHLTVTEIALACGFDSLATFYRTFRQTCGLAPGDMRKDLQRA
jgi:transcriptional regulator GlxA family with amidase domain